MGTFARSPQGGRSLSPPHDRAGGRHHGRPRAVGVGGRPDREHRHERRTGAGQTKSVPPDQRAGRERPGPIPETRTSLGPDRGTIGRMGQTCNCVCRIAGGGNQAGAQASDRFERAPGCLTRPGPGHEDFGPGTQVQGVGRRGAVRGVGRRSSLVRMRIMSAAGGLWAVRRGIYLCPSLAARGAGQPAPRLRTATRARRKLGEKLSPSLISLS